MTPPSSSSKRQKLSLQEEKGRVDRISDLPDCLLCHILAFLPTKQAVTTSILSSRWKTLWTFVPCLYLDYSLQMRSSSSLHEQWNHSITFSDIMSQVFAQHKVPYLRKFHLNATEWSCNAFDVETWLGAAISPNLEEFDLHLYNYSGQIFELPRTIFSCKNLVVLKLSGKILLNLPSSFKLPSLKILLLWITTLNDDSKRGFLSCCPVLEDLNLGLEVKLEICVPTLKRLKIVSTIFKHEYPDYPDYVLVINAPALEYFNFKGDLWEVVFLEKPSNLVEANVSWPLLREIYNVKSLSLSNGSTKRLSFVYFDLPMFHNLTRLNYEFSCCNWDVLWYLLEQAPNLEVFIVYKSYCRSHNLLKLPRNVSRGFKGLKDLHLTTFYFRGFEGLEDELKFVRCILKKAIALKKMTFKYWDNLQTVEEEKNRILKKVSKFPRHSMSCRIAFEWGVFLMGVDFFCNSLFNYLVAYKLIWTAF